MHGLHVQWNFIERSSDQRPLNAKSAARALWLLKKCGFKNKEIASIT